MPLPKKCKGMHKQEQQRKKMHCAGKVLDVSLLSRKKFK